MYSVYLDEALLAAAGLLGFPEYYAYILERDQEPVPPAQRIPIGEQTLQQHLKVNDDILFSTNEEFVPPVSHAPTKLDLSSQFERSSFLASSGSDPQLIVFGDGVILTVSYETTRLFLNGYLFNSYHEEAKPKEGDKVIALVRTDPANKNSGHAYNSFYVVDDWTCKVRVFNQYFETKGQTTSIQETVRIPDVKLSADGKTVGIFNKLKKLVQVVGKGISWMSDKVVKLIMPITNALLQSLGPAGNIVAKGISRVHSIKEILDKLSPQTESPNFMNVNFTVSIPHDDLLIFSAFCDYPNSLFGDLKIEFKINPNAFVFCYVDPVMYMAIYYTFIKEELMSSSQDKLKDINLFFRNWSLTFQFTNMISQIGCTADLITGIRADELTPSGLKNLNCDFKPVTISIRNYVIESVIANLCGQKASDTCPNCIRQFYQNCPYVVPAQRIESQVFPSATSSS
ncbi:MAG: hypothetical protein EZS28_013675 [Streblomastix strix]|uniref:Uncharacterized protein n=1 Tax=Streblomastix strix TaxID=222440 RepID=A0A5J4W7K8_9EUKA|nr:MAG: hypothetical protein EZS28_013675 [Streblomastix strix]